MDSGIPTSEIKEGRNHMKICSLLPSGTEILFRLGLGDQLAGVSDLCDYPPDTRSKQVVSRSKVDPSVLSSEESGTYPKPGFGFESAMEKWI